MSNDERLELFSRLLILFLFSILFFIGSSLIICCDIGSDSSVELLENLCDQYYDTYSCSFIYKNDDVVLFDTYNGYVTMENIFEK